MNTNQESALILWFKELSKNDVEFVGGKNASLGELYQHMSAKGIRVTNGFALTAYAYRLFLKESGIEETIEGYLKELDTQSLESIEKTGALVRDCILNAEFPESIVVAVKEAYDMLSKEYDVAAVDVAVRSSATAEDLPDASFAGQQETYLNISGSHEVLEATKRCIASLFTNRAISYRADNGYDHNNIALSVGIQKMVRADLACSGVLFTLDPETGFRNSVVINASWGLGELVVQGKVQPDEYIIFKTPLKEGMSVAADGVLTTKFRPLVEKKLGVKDLKMVYSSDGAVSGHGTVREVATSAEEFQNFTLTEDECLQLGAWACLIEEHYGMPMDIEWGKDGQTGKLFILQARPETVQSQKNAETVLEEYQLLDRDGAQILSGIAVGARIGSGKVRIITDAKQMHEFEEGDVLVSEITDPDWEPIMKKASAIVTNGGGRTSHAAIVSRELGIPAVVGTQRATIELKTGQEITVCCADGETGMVYDGLREFEIQKTDLSELPEHTTQMMMIVGDPRQAYRFAAIPNQGVGLARLEMIILNNIRIHPLALLNFETLTDAAVKKQIEELTYGYPDKAEFFIDKLAQGIAKIGSAFAPYDVIVRMSDFKSNEYAGLIGGTAFEPHEENPMIGWRGASRYYSESYEAAFALECEAMRRVRDVMGITNVKAMIPFCRTPEEGKRVLETMEKYGLKRGENGLEVYVMCEVPSNVILAEQFAEIFDGFSIGSNDLTQLTLGLDRDSGLVAHLYDERNAAVKWMVKHVIEVAKKTGTKIGICGQGPSDFPDFAEFLVECGIDSMALTPDRVIATTMLVGDLEAKK